MTQLILPWEIHNDTPADGTKVEDNNSSIEHHVNTELINRDGSVAMAQPLLLSGDPTLDNQAANKGYVDAKASALITNKVSVAGDTMTGSLQADAGIRLPVQSIAVPPTGPRQAISLAYADLSYVSKTGDTMTGALLLPSTQSTNVNAAVRKKYVDDSFVAKAGDTMTGLLVAGAGVQLPAQGVTPPTAVQAIRKDYADSFYVKQSGDVMDGDLRIGGVPDSSGVPDAGVMLESDGHVKIVSPVSDAVTVPTVIIGRGGSPSAGTNAKYVKFERGGGEIGSITIDTATSVAFNTTSDERTKHRDGDITDAAERVQRLGALAFRGQILDDDGNPDGTERDLIYAHDVAVEAPYVVNGERGGEEYQTVNFTGLIPLLLAALGDALDRIAVLEAA